MFFYYEKAFPDQVTGVYINPSFFIRLGRILKRDKGDYRKSFKRYVADVKEFRGLEDFIEIRKIFKI